MVAGRAAPAPVLASAEGTTRRPPGRGGSALRARLAQDRATQGRRRSSFLRRRLPALVGAVVLLVAGLWAAQAPILRSLAQQPGALGSWALGRLVALRDPGSFGLYVERFLSDSETYHLVVFEVGGRSEAPERGASPPPEDPAGVLEHRRVLVEALASPRRQVRAGALRAVFALKDRPWIADPELLARVTTFLDLGDGPALTPGEAPRERRFAALILREVGAQAAAPRAALRAAALRDPDRQVRRFAVEALGRSADRGEQETLQEALRDEAPEVVRAAHLALVQVGAEVSFEVLADLLQEDASVLRPEVLRVLAGRQEPEAARLLLRGRKDPVASSRLAAVEGLASRDGGAAREGLERALAARDAAVRLAAAEALGARGDGGRAVPALIEALGRHQGWHELRALHHALRRLTGVDVNDPVQGEPASWSRAVEAWRRHLGQGAR